MSVEFILIYINSSYFVISPDGRRFRTRTEIKAYIEENPQLKLSESMFDFSICRRSRKETNKRSSVSAPVEPPPLETSVPPAPAPLTHEVTEEEGENHLNLNV